MGATFPIITRRVGEGGQTRGIEVRRIQQLLKLAGNDPGQITDEWNNVTQKAWLEFQTECNWYSVKPYIDKEDADLKLFVLADCAGVLLELPHNLRSQSGARKLFENCRNAEITYGWVQNGKEIGGGTRSIWGFEGYKSYAVATRGYHSADAEFDLRVPLSLNCTSFTSLMLSIWSQGNVHSAPYDRSQESGGSNPIALRYNLRPAPEFYVLNPPGIYDVNRIKGIVEPARIYYLGICNELGSIHHDMVMFDQVIYECNLNRTPAVYSTPLDEHPLAQHSRFTLYGPGPF